MGLSSSKSTTTQSTSQNSNQTENATTTPVTPDWLTQAAQDYVGRIGSFGDMDPNGFVAAASPLQQTAWQNAGSLGDWRQQAATASQLAYGAGQSGPNLAGFADMRARFDPQLSGGGSAQSAANALGGDKVAPMHSSNLAPPQNAFSAAAGPAYTYRAPDVQAPAHPAAYAAQPTSLSAAPQIGGQSYQAPTLNAPGLVSGAGYSAPQLGNAQGYAAARVGAPIGATAATYQAPTVGAAQTASAAGYNPALSPFTTLGNVTDATATNAGVASGLTNLAAYQNPYQQQVVDATLANYDRQTGRALAANQAAAARNGALGGSRYAIEDAQLQSDMANGRAQLQASLLSNGFNTAAGLAANDAGLQQQTNLFNAQNDTGISAANAAAANQRMLSQGQLDRATNAESVAALNDSYRANVNAQNQASLFNAQQDSARAQLQAQLEAQSASQNAGAQTGISQFNAGQGLQAGLAQAGLDTDANRYLADIGNQYGLQQAGLDANALQFGAANNQQAALANQQMAGQYGLAQAGLAADAAKYGADSNMQAALANQQLGGQYGLAQFGADTQGAQNYAAALNAAGLTGYQGALSSAQLGAQLAAAAGQYNATANNQMSQFNAGQADSDANRQLQAAQLLGGLANDYGAGTRADLTTMGQLGDQQRAIEQAYAMAGPAQLQLMGQLSGMTPYDILVGRNVSGTTNGMMTGTSTAKTTQTPSLFDSMLRLGNAAAQFIPA